MLHRRWLPWLAVSAAACAAAPLREPPESVAVVNVAPAAPASASSSSQGRPALADDAAPSAQAAEIEELAGPVAVIQAPTAPRQSQHQGAWSVTSASQYLPALQNYSGAVRPGNQVALNAARVPFATYLVAMHNRIHPIFADGFLASLSNLPANHPLGDPRLLTTLEIVVSGADGRVVKVGVLRASGITAFDVAALDAVMRAAPFGKPPDAIRSADGNVYVHWEFHRDPVMSCSTANTRPFILR